MTTQMFNAEAVELMSATFPTRQDVALQMGMLDSLYCNLPAIRSFWNMARIGSTLMLDAVGGQDLTNVDVTFQCPRYVTHAIFNGTTAHLYRADEATQDVTGLETQIVDKGLTVGAWIYPLDTTIAQESIIAKREVTTNVAFQLRISGATPYMVTTPDGTAFKTLGHTGTVTQNSLWHFIVGQFYPDGLGASYLRILLDDQGWVTGGFAGASIFNSTAPITIGAYRTLAAATGHLFKGNIALPFMVGSKVPDYYIWAIWQWTKHLFGR
jgi:hypothetical protein